MRYRDMTDQEKISWLHYNLAYRLNPRRPETEFSTSDPQWVEYAKESMMILGDLKKLIEQNPRDILDTLEIGQEGLRLNFFPTKAEARQFAQDKGKSREGKSREEMMAEWALQKDEWEQKRLKREGTHAIIANGMRLPAAG